MAMFKMVTNWTGLKEVAIISCTSLFITPNKKPSNKYLQRITILEKINKIPC